MPEPDIWELVSATYFFAKKLLAAMCDVVYLCVAHLPNGWGWGWLKEAPEI